MALMTVIYLTIFMEVKRSLRISRWLQPIRGRYCSNKAWTLRNSDWDCPVGMINTAKMVQVFTTQTAFLGHALETGIGLLGKELKEKTQKLKDQEAETKLLEAAEEKLVTEQKGHREDADHLKVKITFQYEKGFEKAVDQVKFLHPEINVAEVGAFKEIRDGKLVDIPDEE
ncbi:hypothetical protein SESBI_26818 [Sesbania bispinosa]|nr:hypothetical protein SESBI_26818 [Sesbania bispinosa]